MQDNRVIAFDTPPALAVGSVKGVHHIMIALIFHRMKYTIQSYLLQSPEGFLRGNRVWLISPCLKAGALRHAWSAVSLYN